MTKKKDQKEFLVEEFNKNHNWTFKDKIMIAEKIGMTVQQVSKWHWDYRKKQGIDTKRKKKSK